MTAYPEEIPLIRVAGTHAEVGRQIGEACAPALRRAVDLDAAGRPRDGRTLAELMAAAAEYRRVTEANCPFLVEELEGVAAGAGVGTEALFAASIEELWERRPSQGCTDVVLAPAATKNGHTLVAHNNDLSPSAEEDLVAIEWRLPGDPVIFSIGIGPWISVGWNGAGISLTGNEVSPNDERTGVPRLLLVRAQLRAPSLEAAAALCVHPARASAYNTVLADNSGRCLNVEASATDCCSTGPDHRGTLAHTNHYVSETMSRFEDDPEYALRSRKRLERARTLIGSLDPTTADEGRLRSILSDHENGVDAICRHPAAVSPDAVKTVFWCIADVTEGRISYGRGNPCQSREQSYVFERYGEGAQAVMSGDRARSS
jgi:isopenicillin-N N-acyltransferase like protein